MIWNIHIMNSEFTEQEGPCFSYSIKVIALQLIGNRRLAVILLQSIYSIHI